MPWRTDLTASGHPIARGPMAVVGTYSATAGTTKPFKPNAADQNMLVTQLSTALAGVKSCTFDLNDVSGKAIKVDTTKLAQAHVKIKGPRSRWIWEQATAGSCWPARHAAGVQRHDVHDLAQSEQQDDRSPVPVRHHHLRVTR